MNNAIFLLFIFLMLFLILNFKKSKSALKAKNKYSDSKKFLSAKKENFKFQFKKDLKPLHISVKISNSNTDCSACCGSSGVV